MSDDERLVLRNLPPVDINVARPARLSQTLLRHADRCPRAAYLYLRWQGGAGSHAMNRGSVVHLFAERLMVELIRRGERSLIAVAPGEALGDVETQVASLTEAMVHEICLEHPELVISTRERDAARSMAYHIALGLDVDPAHVAGVERKFVLDLPSGWTVSGKIDLLSLPEPGLAIVDDYKTSFHVPTEEEFVEDPFQTMLYAALVAFGCPVEKRDGVEVRLDPIGAHLDRVHGRQLYPRRRLQSDGSLARRERTDSQFRPWPWTRTDLADFVQDLDLTARRIDHGLATGEWEAVPGSWCVECPSEPSCPLPAFLRGWHGSIRSREQAEEALAWSERVGSQVRATNAEVRRFAKTLPSGLVRVGDGDLAYRLTEKSGRQVRRAGRHTDWAGLEDAIRRAVQYGEPFVLAEWVRVTAGTEFKKVKLSAEERAAFNDDEQGDADAAERRDGGDGRDADGPERFGDVPF